MNTIFFKLFLLVTLTGPLENNVLAFMILLRFPECEKNQNIFSKQGDKLRIDFLKVLQYLPFTES